MKQLEINLTPVSDQQKAKEFYLALGFEVRVEAPAEHGQTWIQMGLPNNPASISFSTFTALFSRLKTWRRIWKCSKQKTLKWRNR